MVSLLLVISIGFAMLTYSRGNSQESAKNTGTTKTIDLSPPVEKSDLSVEEAFSRRRSIRNFENVPLSLAEISQLLWSAQGITDNRGFRTSPSAGALYPLEIYVVADKIEGLSAGVYKYLPSKHELELISDGNKLAQLADAALMQAWVENSPAVIVITAVYERTTIKYGKRGIRYVHIEVGCAAQNIYLQSVSLNLGTTFIGAFDDQQVKNVLNIPDNENPLAIMPIGKYKQERTR
ncbi:MAG: nitroreductase [Candidatus Zixiibacteriota bacterium]|nr:MAG: nitroreductase [candidate division Zixibacteria bacterium]